jgi:ABC-type phosphate transport system substrate-binding protein
VAHSFWLLCSYIQVYMASGSAAGKANVITGATDWGALDSPILAADLVVAPDLQVYPTFAAPIVNAYNVEGFATNQDPPLNFSRSTLVAIFSANLTWYL